jgi:hypothetical protein
MSTTASPI